MRQSWDGEMLARFISGVHIRVVLVAVLINFPWELAQSPLYTQPDEWVAMVWQCALASLGDGVLVLLIAAIGALLLQRRTWFLAPGPVGYAVMLLTGLLIAIVVEWLAIDGLSLWSYTPAMPRLPILGVGLAPVAQMLLLPPLVFALVARWRSPRLSPAPD